MRKWSDEDKLRLVEGVSQGFDLATIASKLDRSVYAIDCQLYKIAQPAMAEGMTFEAAQQQFKFTTATAKKMEAAKKPGKEVKFKAAALPFAVTPQDRILAYNAFMDTLRQQVDTLKKMGAADQDLEEQIVRGLAHVAALVDRYQTAFGGAS